MRGMPGLVVIAPADDLEARAALGAALRHDGPVYMRLARDPGPRVRPAAVEFEIGAAVPLRGQDVTVLPQDNDSARSAGRRSPPFRGMGRRWFTLPCNRSTSRRSSGARATGLVVSSGASGHRGPAGRPPGPARALPPADSSPGDSRRLGRVGDQR
jgi:hypothetical protein